MKRSDSIEYHVSEHFLSALINGDDSGLTDQEIAQLEDFEHTVKRDTPAGFKFGHFSAPNDYAAEFGACEICGQYAQIVPLTAIYWNKNV